tara:strand:- start:175 stop:444 length:270 start_codon:yes stop_codon:yes gene_type:complete
MGVLKKYEFTNELEFLELTSEVTFSNKPIILGFVELEKPNYNLIGIRTSPPILSTKYCIDIYWNDDEDSSVLNSYEVFPKKPKHKIAGQ